MKERTEHTPTIGAAVIFLMTQIAAEFLTFHAIFFAKFNYPIIWALCFLAFSLLVFLICVSATKDRKSRAWILLPLASAMLPLLPFALIGFLIVTKGYNPGH